MTIKISLPDEVEAFVDAQVTNGHFASADDVICEALRLMELNAEIEAGRLAWLKEAYRIGVESGEPEELDPETIKAEGRALLRKAAE
ncbi:MAG: putative transcriptional regulator, CopG/Arc/MetJ DNA-binding domain [Bradyrhizobium sp.]|nr:putative transcriptional regulator, CopG/Arc/MetJ DNA-binding domain [Bradyrhizobium sp.]